MKLKGIDSGYLVAISGLVISAILAIMCLTRTTERETSDSSPVEEIVKIDSISRENSKLVIEVNYLDSIKDAKVIEVKKLDNDSTLKLFYQLIRKQ